MTDTNRPLRVFLCHSSNDKPIVRELYQKLRAEPWLQPWLDEEELYPGQDWNLEIEKAVEASDAIIVCLSKNSINKEGYVQRELRLALDVALTKPEDTIFVIPLRLEECELPRRLRAWQYADYFESQRDREFQRLLVSLKKRVESLGLVLDLKNTERQIPSPQIRSSEPNVYSEKTRDVQIFINGSVIGSNINLGNNNQIIISKDESGNTDYHKSVSNAYMYLETIKTEFDRENIIFARRLIENVKEIILALGDENLSLEYEILVCRCLQKFEKIDEAREKYENISKRYPQDPRPLLYIAEICLSNNNFNENNALLEKAEKIDSNFWLLKLQHILRKQNLGGSVDIRDVDEKTFPGDPKIKANYYRLYGLLLENSGDKTNADSFLAKSIHLNPDRFSSYLDELSLIERRMFASQDELQRSQLSSALLAGIEKVTNKFAAYGDIGVRNKVYLNTKKFNALLVQEDAQGLEQVSKDIFNFAISCHFDRHIEKIISGIFRLVSLPDNELDRLLTYLKASKKRISDELSGVLIFQFNIRGALFTVGKVFFEEIGNQRYLEFIRDLESNNHERVLGFLKQDVSLAIILASTLKDSTELRKKIIENLPDDKNIQKDKLYLLLSFDKKDFNEAFQILKQLDLSNLDYFECVPMLYVARQNKAWEFVIVILEKLLVKEHNEKEIFSLRLELLYAYLNLNKYPEVMNIGEQLLIEDSVKRFLDLKNREGLLGNTLYACLERGKIDNDAVKTAVTFLEKYPIENPSFGFKVGIEAEVHLRNNAPKSALKAIIDGIKARKILSPQEYAKLYFHFVRIGNQIKELNTDSLDIVQENTFVKLKDKDQWFFVGNQHELDALLITTTSNKYPLFIDKKLGDIIIFEGKYGSESYEDQIHLILTVEQYVLWQVVQNFQKLAVEGDLDGVVMIKVPPKDDTIDLQYLLEYFKDLHARTEPLFEVFCKNNVPLAMLALSEGGLVSAIGRIQQEGKGFININGGSTEEHEKQKEIAKRVVEGKMPFYIDGTSALFLSEIGMLQKIYAHIPNLKVPQSVINLLIDVADNFRFEPGLTGYRMGYARGNLTFSSTEKNKANLLRSNFIASIKLLELNPNSPSVISSASKMDCLSEKQSIAELSDACIMSQKENLPVMTEDFLYLKMNESETKKRAPEYFSSLALMRVLYEKKLISFDEYLEYFGYLSTYRFRFLSINSDDIEKAVFGDGIINVVKPENIRRLNFPFTLSEDYGVSFQDAFRVVVAFLFKVLIDSTIISDIAERIFIEILESFPTHTGKKELGHLMLAVCVKVFEKNRSRLLLHINDQSFRAKVERLLHMVEIYSADSKLWTPHK